MPRQEMREDRMFCSCDYQDMPHRYQRGRCEPGYTSADFLREQGKAVRPIRKKPNPPGWLRRIKKEEVTGWECPHCGTPNPFSAHQCVGCGK